MAKKLQTEKVLIIGALILGIGVLIGGVGVGGTIFKTLQSSSAGSTESVTTPKAGGKTKPTVNVNTGNLYTNRGASVVFVNPQITPELLTQLGDLSVVVELTPPGVVRETLASYVEHIQSVVSTEP